MGNIESFFFDTYALYEIIAGNENYKKYTTKVGMVLTKLNVMELHYGLLLQYGKKTADAYFDELAEFTIEISDEVIKKANEFRAAQKKRKLSYIDCIGYTMAKMINIKFLTGDRQFKDMENVEFMQ